MYSKCTFSLAFLIAIIIATYAPSYAYGGSGWKADTNRSHHLIAGSRLPGDRLSYQENIIKPSKLWRVITVEKTFYAASNERISQVVALDQKTNGNGAYARIVKGGPGLNNVTIKFKSQRNHGINFIVRIYSRH